MITPLHDQILIRPLPIDDVLPAGLVMPDSAKKTTVQGEDGSRINFVLAEVVAVGSGRRRVDADLVPDLIDALKSAMALIGDLRGRAHLSNDSLDARFARLIDRAEQPIELIPLDVKPGDVIYYHPAVRNFDRSVEVDGVEHFIIGEHSLLAIVDTKP